MPKKKTMPKKKEATPPPAESEEEEEDDEEVGEEDEEYSVEEILDKRIKKGKVEYYIKWNGLGEEENTWEPEVNIESRDLIAEFEESRRKEEAKEKSEVADQPVKKKAKTGNKAKAAEEDSAADTEPIIYLSLEAEGKPLGRVRIRLTCGPNRMKQMMDLCTEGGSTLKGSFFDKARFVNNPGEALWCQGYMTPDGERGDNVIVKDLEIDSCKWQEEGVVSGYMDDACFWICTRTLESAKGSERPVIGRVVTGMDLLRKIIGQYTKYENLYWYDSSKIKIAEAGVETTG